MKPQCTSCKSQGSCPYESLMSSWRYIDQKCVLKQEKLDEPVTR